MSNLFQKDVLLLCSCGSLRPLSKLYFCRHCIILRCSYCLSHEVDSIYCSNCLVNLATSEAKLKKNRCGACFDCPNCFHTLTIRASTLSKINPASTGTPNQVKTTVKNYYLACFFCRWTSREARIADQSTATSSHWPDVENEYADRVSNLVEYYRLVTSRELPDRESRLFYARRGYQHFGEKFGLTAVLARKRAGLPPLSMVGEDATAPPEIARSVAVEEPETLDEDIFVKPVELTMITSLAQRYVVPHLQPERISEMFPMHKRLFIKRSLRCRSCSHNIFKPEYGPASIKFKIHQAAYYYVPEIRLMRKVSIRKGEKTEVIFRLSNPVQIATSISFHDYLLPLLPTGEKELTNVIEPVRPLKMKANGKISLPSVTFLLPARDDVAEYDENGDLGQFHDNPEIIVWRKGNKVAIRCFVETDEAKENEDIIVSFYMRYTYLDKIISPLEQKEGKQVDVNVRHFLNIGQLSSKGI